MRLSTLNMSLAATIMRATMGAAALAIPVAPNIALPVTDGLLARWNANFSTVSVSGGRINAVSDLTGNGYPLGDEATGLGPRLTTYPNGLKAFRFNQDSFLSADTPTLGPLASTVIAIIRDHNTRANNKTIVSAGKRSTTGGGKLAYTTAGVNGAAPYVGRAGTSSDTVVKPYLALGCQMQVAGWRNGAIGTPGTAASNTVGQRCAVNQKSLNVANQNAASAAGLEVGRNSATTTSSSTVGAQNVANGDWYTGDIIELIVYSRPLRDDEFDLVMRALSEAYRIPEIKGQFALEGDSRICSVLPTLPAENPGMWMTDPGSPYALPKDVRVINYAVGGSTTIYAPNGPLRGRLDIGGATSGFQCLIPGGRNLLALMVGHNDLSQSAVIATADNPLTIYQNVNSLIHNASANSYLTLGWEVVLIVEIHNNNERYINGGNGWTGYRALQRSQVAGYNLLTDNNAGPGQTYEGKLRNLDVPLMTVGGQTVFATGPDTLNTNYYLPDRLHQAAEGMRVFVTGGDTPQHGLRSVWPS